MAKFFDNVNMWSKYRNSLKLNFMLSISFIINVWANIDNEFIYDYFVTKKPASIVGFSCNNFTGIILIITNNYFFVIVCIKCLQYALLCRHKAVTLRLL